MVSLVKEVIKEDKLEGVAIPTPQDQPSSSRMKKAEKKAQQSVTAPPRTDAQSSSEKSRARRTINDAPLPKVNWYLSHIFFFHFSNFLCTSFDFSTACLKFPELFSAC